MFRAIPKSDRSDRNNVLEKLIPVAENQCPEVAMSRERSSYRKIPIHATSDVACWFGGTRKENKSLSAFCSRLRADCVQRLETKRLTGFSIDPKKEIASVRDEQSLSLLRVVETIELTTARAVVALYNMPFMSLCQEKGSQRPDCVVRPDQRTAGRSVQAAHQSPSYRLTSTTHTKGRRSQIFPIIGLGYSLLPILQLQPKGDPREPGIGARFGQ